MVVNRIDSNMNNDFTTSAGKVIGNAVKELDFIKNMTVGKNKKEIVSSEDNKYTFDAALLDKYNKGNIQYLA